MRLKPDGAYQELIGREQWGAMATAAPFEDRGDLRQLVLHHTAIRDPALNGGDRAPEAAYMRRIERLHLERGWLAIGYHFVVMPSGRVYEGRPVWAVGAHAEMHNQDSVSIALAGNFEEETPQPAALRSLEDLERRFAANGRPLPLHPHGDLMPTACPGRLLRAALSG